MSLSPCAVGRESGWGTEELWQVLQDAQNGGRKIRGKLSSTPSSRFRALFVCFRWIDRESLKQSLWHILSHWCSYSKRLVHTHLASSTSLPRDKRRPATDCSRWCHFLLLSHIHIIRSLVRIWLKVGTCASSRYQAHLQWAWGRGYSTPTHTHTLTCPRSHSLTRPHSATHTQMIRVWEGYLPDAKAIVWDFPKDMISYVLCCNYQCVFKFVATSLSMFN